MEVASSPCGSCPTIREPSRRSRPTRPPRCVQREREEPPAQGGGLPPTESAAPVAWGLAVALGHSETGEVDGWLLGVVAGAAPYEPVAGPQAAAMEAAAAKPHSRTSFECIGGLSFEVAS